MTTRIKRYLSKAEEDLLELIRQFESSTGRKYDPNSPMSGGFDSPASPWGLGIIGAARSRAMGTGAAAPDKGFAQSQAYQE